MRLACIDRRVELVAHQAAAAGPLARRNILDWRDRHKLASALALARCWQDMRPTVNERIEAIGWYDAAVTPSAFIEQEVDPLLVDGISSTVERLVKDAQDDLRKIVEHQLSVTASVAQVGAHTNTFEDATELLSGIAPLAGGLALGAALPSMAVVTGATAFGLVATSTVSVPILLGGLALAGGAIATGAVKTSQLRDYRSKSIRKRIETHVEQSVLSTSPPPTQSTAPSVLFQIHQALDEAASKAMETLK